MMYMQPQGVKQAILAIWLTLAISAVSALIAKILGISSEGDFVIAIIVYALFCIIPYKLTNRSNASRYVYLIITIISVLFWAAGIGKINKIDLTASIIIMPVEVFILYRLFQAESSVWFTSR